MLAAGGSGRCITKHVRHCSLLTRNQDLMSLVPSSLRFGCTEGLATSGNFSAHTVAPTCHSGHLLRLPQAAGNTLNMPLQGPGGALEPGIARG